MIVIVIFVRMFHCRIYAFDQEKEKSVKQNLLVWSTDATDFTWHDLIKQQLITLQRRSFFCIFCSNHSFVFCWPKKWEREKKSYETITLIKLHSGVVYEMKQWKDFSLYSCFCYCCCYCCCCCYPCKYLFMW